DGRHFLYLQNGGGPAIFGIYTASLDGKENRRVLADNSAAIFAPDAPGSSGGRILFLRETSVIAQPFDAGSRQLSGDASPVAENVYPIQGGFNPIAASGNGVLMYWTGGTGGLAVQLVWYDRSGKPPAPEGTPARAFTPAISPDEKMIVFTVPNGGGRDIWVRDLMRGNDRRL